MKKGWFLGTTMLLFASLCVFGQQGGKKGDSPQVAGGRLLENPQPVYPPLARQARIQGQVVFDVVIATDGSVKELHLVSGHPMLIRSAAEAVQQRKYEPFIVDGKPSEVETQITVNFSLSGEDGTAGAIQDSEGNARTDAHNEHSVPLTPPPSTPTPTQTATPSPAPASAQDVICIQLPVARENPYDSDCVAIAKDFDQYEFKGFVGGQGRIEAESHAHALGFGEFKCTPRANKEACVASMRKSNGQTRDGLLSATFVDGHLGWLTYGFVHREYAGIVAEIRRKYHTPQMHRVVHRSEAQPRGFSLTLWDKPNSALLVMEAGPPDWKGDVGTALLQDKKLCPTTDSCSFLP